MRSTVVEYIVHCSVENSVPSNNGQLPSASPLQSIARFAAYANATVSKLIRMMCAYAPSYVEESLQTHDCTMHLLELDGKRATASPPLSMDTSVQELGIANSTEPIHFAFKARQRSLMQQLMPPLIAPTDTQGRTMGRNGALRLHNDSTTREVAPVIPSPELMHVRVLGHCIPKNVRVVLDCSPQSLVGSLFSPMVAKLRQLRFEGKIPGDTELDCINDKHMCLHVFTMLGVGKGAAGRRLDNMESLCRVVDEGVNILTVLLQSLPPPPPKPTPLADTERRCGQLEARRTCFVSSSAWIDEDDDGSHHKGMTRALDANQMTSDATSEHCGSELETMEHHGLETMEGGGRYPADHPQVATVLHLNLDLPLEVDYDKEPVVQLAPMPREEPPAPVVLPPEAVPNPLEDEFDVVENPQTLNDCEELELDFADEGDTLQATQWNLLPMSLLCMLAEPYHQSGSSAPPLVAEDLCCREVSDGSSVVSWSSLWPSSEKYCKDSDEQALTIQLEAMLAALDPRWFVSSSPEVTTADMARILAYTDLRDVEANYSWSAPSVESLFHMPSADLCLSEHLLREFVEDTAKQAVNRASAMKQRNVPNDNKATVKAGGGFHHHDVDLEDVQTTCAAVVPSGGVKPAPQTATNDESTKLEENPLDLLDLQQLEHEEMVREASGSLLPVAMDGTLDESRYFALLDAVRCDESPVQPAGQQRGGGGSRWPEFVGGTPPTDLPEHLRRPLPIQEIAERLKYSERQHAHYKQQALLPLLPEHRKIHEQRMERERRLAEDGSLLLPFHHESSGAQTKAKVPSPVKQPTRVRSMPVRREYHYNDRNLALEERDHHLPPINRSTNALVDRTSVAGERRGEPSDGMRQRALAPQAAQRRDRGKPTHHGGQQQQQPFLPSLATAVSVYGGEQPARGDLRASRPSAFSRPDSMSFDFREPLQRGAMQPTSLRDSSGRQSPIRQSFHNTLNQSYQLGGGEVGQSHQQQQGPDVFHYLTQTLRSMHPDGSFAHSASGSHREGGGRENLDMLRASVVAEYTQRLLQEHQEIAHRAAELARMLQGTSVQGR